MNSILTTMELKQQGMEHYWPVVFSVTDLYAFALGWMHKNTNTTHSRLKKIKIAIDTYR